MVNFDSIKDRLQGKDSEQVITIRIERTIKRNKGKYDGNGVKVSEVVAIVSEP